LTSCAATEREAAITATAVKIILLIAI